MEQGLGVLFNYGALGVMSASGLFVTWFILKELRAILLAVHETVKEIKDLHSQSARDTLAYERERVKECNNIILNKLDEIHSEIKELQYIQEKCQAIGCGRG